MVFSDYVGAGADLSRVVDQPTHLTDVAISVDVLLDAIDDRSQEARWDTRHGHFLQAGIADRRSGSAWGDGTHDSQRLNDGAPWTTS